MPEQVNQYCQYNTDYYHGRNWNKDSSAFCFNIDVTWQFAKPVQHPWEEMQYGSQNEQRGADYD